MSSATPKKSNHAVNQGKGGAATAVMLSGCVLFFFFQLFSYYSSTSPLSAYNLEVSEVHTLRLVPEAIRKEWVATATGYKFTPFFFRPVLINYSDQSLLMTVKGIGPSLAQRIINSREGAGPFRVPEDLLRVKGIGPKRLQQFSPQFSFFQDLETE